MSTTCSDCVANMYADVKDTCTTCTLACTGAQDICLIHTKLTAKKGTYTRASRPVRPCSNFFTIETIAIYLEIWRFVLIDGKQKTFSWTMMTLYLNRTSNAVHAGITPRLIAQHPHVNPSTFNPSDLLYLSSHLVISPKKLSKFTPAHDTVAAAAVLSHGHQSIIHSGAGPIQLVYGSPPKRGHATNPSHNYIFAIFAGVFHTYICVY